MGVILYNNSVGLVYPIPSYLLFYDVVGHLLTRLIKHISLIFSVGKTTTMIFSYDTYIPDLNFLRFLLSNYYLIILI